MLRLFVLPSPGPGLPRVILDDFEKTEHTPARVRFVFEKTIPKGSGMPFLKARKHVTNDKIILHSQILQSQHNLQRLRLLSRVRYFREKFKNINSKSNAHIEYFPCFSRDIQSLFKFLGKR